VVEKALSLGLGGACHAAEALIKRAFLRDKPL
jgi:hypothetical protein